MTNNDEWNEFLDNLLSNAVKNYKASKEYEYKRQRETQMDEFLSANLTVKDKTFVEDIFFELGLAAERESEVIYNQGIKDCIWILKNLGLIA